MSLSRQEEARSVSETFVADMSSIFLESHKYSSGIIWGFHIRQRIYNFTVKY
jgi:hypothetical protein